jgi:alanine racemase
MDMARAGISIYGIYPSREVNREKVRLYPAMELKSHIVYIKTVETGTPVSYGGTFVAERPMRIATIPVGYGDGYPRSLSNKGFVLIRGRRAPIIGRVCMDQFMVDVTQIDAELLDEVTLLGRDGDEAITLEELDRLSGRFPYEFVCDIGKRVPRVYRTDSAQQ